MKDFETYTVTRPVVKLVPKLDVGIDPETLQGRKKEVSEVVEWYVRHDPVRAASVGGLTRIVKLVSEDVGWSSSDVHNAIESTPIFETNLAQHTVKITEAS